MPKDASGLRLDDGWLHVWAVGSNGRRRCCRIGTVPNGFAVLVFEGDTCVHSVACATFEGAYRAAELAKEEYAAHFGIDESSLS